ncbi:signal peptidase II [Gracilinema caldarium]|uniref:Lipoprotein signal peptidase n=1 Tax=Gracilinema caldarium (strain ATCC 51460 / DSM 7334 / H1) TaxID=744872 RepID=F8EWN1_GRAC1|nr:signal peptidase II [Gracilinema caldarium]AEJ18194.1 Lipoprotein signal peptidase [Gracilinema caldarium DSM 7334]
MKYKQKLFPFILTFCIVVVDQLSKAFIVSRWPREGTFIKDVFGNDLLWIIHVRNKAIAFSLGDGLPDQVRVLLFIMVPIVVLGVLLVYYFKTDEFTTLQRWVVAGIIGGGLGNLIDRIWRPDGVVDFISVNVYGFLGFARWPTFNIADSSVVICGILLVISILFVAKNTHKE